MDYILPKLAEQSHGDFMLFYEAYHFDSDKAELVKVAHSLRGWTLGIASLPHYNNKELSDEISWLRILPIAPMPQL